MSHEEGDGGVHRSSPPFDPDTVGHPETGPSHRSLHWAEVGTKERDVAPPDVRTEVPLAPVRTQVHPEVVRGRLLGRPQEGDDVGTPGLVVRSVEDRLCLLIKTVKI